MKVRIRIPGLTSAALHALDRKARLFLGRNGAAIEAVDVTLSETARAPVEHSECEVLVTLRDGGSIRVVDDGGHIHRALLRAAWRIDQRRELNRVRGAGTPGPARSPF
jgi:hypothetical protein